MKAKNLLTPAEFIEYLQPILLKVENLEAIFYKKGGNCKAVFSDTEASEFLKCSTKKLQSLRNSRAIGFIRENGGRKIPYKLEHLLKYLGSYEMKKKRQNNKRK